MSEPVITIKNLGVKFGSSLIHKDISFSVNQAETVTILGPSGTGKTILLKCIIGLIKPSWGSVTVLGVDLQFLSENELNELRMNVGMLFQGAALFDSLTVYDNIAYGLREHGEESEDKISRIVEAKLDLIGLPGIESKFPSQLSGGQKKRVALARTLASNPKIVLFDEPTTGLDPTSRRMIDDLIIHLREEYEVTSLVVTHDIESAKRVSTRWVLINAGEIVADGPVQDLAQLNPEVIEFISGNWQAESVVGTA